MSPSDTPTGVTMAGADLAAAHPGASVNDAPGSARRPAGTARSPGSGLVLAVAGAALLGACGPFGKALIEAGLSPVQAVWIRIAGSALVLLPLAVATGHLRWALVKPSLVPLLAYGALAVAGVQGFYYLAVSRLPVGVALLLEYLAPVLIVLWTRLVLRRTVPRAAVVGAVTVVIGLALVVQVWSGLRLDLLGLLAGLAAAVCQASYFLLSDSIPERLSPLGLFAAGTAVATVIVGVLARPWEIDWSVLTGPATVAGRPVPAVLVAAWVVLLSTVLAYLLGIAAIRRLSAPVAAVIASTEVLFAVLIAWIALGETLTPIQFLGAAVLLLGAVAAQTAVEPDRAHGPPDRRTVPAPHTPAERGEQSR